MKLSLRRLVQVFFVLLVSVVTCATLGVLGSLAERSLSRSVMDSSAFAGNAVSAVLLAMLLLLGGGLYAPIALAVPIALGALGFVAFFLALEVFRRCTGVW